MAGDIANISQQLGAAVELTMNPSVPMEQRHQVSRGQFSKNVLTRLVLGI